MAADQLPDALDLHNPRIFGSKKYRRNTNSFSEEPVTQTKPASYYAKLVFHLQSITKALQQQNDAVIPFNKATSTSLSGPYTLQAQTNKTNHHFERISGLDSQ
jgi:hypothetical protein